LPSAPIGMLSCNVRRMAIPRAILKCMKMHPIRFSPLLPLPIVGTPSCYAAFEDVKSVTETY
jgi:hypothetical protein